MSIENFRNIHFPRQCFQSIETPAFEDRKHKIL